MVVVLLVRCVLGLFPKKLVNMVVGQDSDFGESISLHG